MARQGKARNVPGAVLTIKAGDSAFANTWRKMRMQLAGQPYVAPPETPVAAKRSKKSAKSTAAAKKNSVKPASAKKNNKFHAPVQAPVAMEPVAAIVIPPAEDAGEVAGWPCPCIIL